MLTGQPPTARFDALPSDALAHIYLREGRYFVEHLDRTNMVEAGFWVGSGSVVSLSSSALDGELGAAVLVSLSRSRVDVPMPERGAKLEAGLFRAMGVRSRREAMAGTRACMVERVRNVLQIQPYQNGGPSGRERGYTPLGPEYIIRLPIGAPTDSVGAAVRKLLASR